MNEQQMQAEINAIKAKSFDQVTGLNDQLQSLAQQVQQQNALLAEIVQIVSPDDKNLTIAELLDRLKVAFKPKSTDTGEDDDGGSQEDEA